VDSMIEMDISSPFALVPSPTIDELAREGRVHYLIVSSRQDDEIWGAIGALWLSADEERGGFLVHPWAIWGGSEFVRSYRSALDRGWTPKAIFEYWRGEVWPGSYTTGEEHEAESLFLLNELVAVL
jgi:hypothetical protein